MDYKLGCLSVDKRTVFRERSSSNSVSFWKQIMFKDKYANTFSSRMDAIVFAILQIFFATRVVLISFPDLLWTKLRPREIWSRDVFRPIARERVDRQCSGCSRPVVLAVSAEMTVRKHPVKRKTSDLLRYQQSDFIKLLQENI